MRESLSDIESRMGWEDLGDPSHHGYPGYLTLSVFPSHKVVAFIHFLSHHLILLECIFSSAFPGCFVLLTFILGLLSYAIKSIIFKMICKTDLSLDDLCFVGGLGITAFIFETLVFALVINWNRIISLIIIYELCFFSEGHCP